MRKIFTSSNSIIQLEAGKHPQPLSKSNFVDKSAGPKANFFSSSLPFTYTTRRSWKVLSFSSRKKSKVEFVTTLKRTLASWKMWNWTLKNVLGILSGVLYLPDFFLSIQGLWWIIPGKWRVTIILTSLGAFLQGEDSNTVYIGYQILKFLWFI